MAKIETETTADLADLSCKYCGQSQEWTSPDGYPALMPLVGCCATRSILAALINRQLLDHPDVTSDVTGHERRETEKLLSRYLHAIREHLACSADPEATWRAAVAQLPELKRHQAASIRPLMARGGAR